MRTRTCASIRMYVSLVSLVTPAHFEKKASTEYRTKILTCVNTMEFVILYKLGNGSFLEQMQLLDRAPLRHYIIGV